MKSKHKASVSLKIYVSFYAHITSDECNAWPSFVWGQSSCEEYGTSQIFIILKELFACEYVYNL